MSRYWGAMSVYCGEKVNNLRGHQRILKSEIIVNLINEAPLARAEGKVREHGNSR